MATAPTFVAAYGGDALSAATKTASVTVQSGDLVVVKAAAEDVTPTLATPTGGGLTFARQIAVEAVTGQSNAYIWTATASSAQTFTLTLAKAAGSAYWTWSVEVWRAHGGVGLSVKKTATSTTTASLTTSGANSAITMVVADWNSVSGARTYVTSTAGAYTEKVYQRVAGDVTISAGYYANAGAVGAKSVGMSAPAGQKPTILALEIQAAPVVVPTGALSITATALPLNAPPAVRVDIADTRSVGQASSLTVTRINPDGSTSPVRTSDGGPLLLSGGVGLVYDYEAPLGVPVAYSSVEAPGITSPQVTVASSQTWLVHPGVPGLSVAVRNFMPGSFTKRTRPVQRGVFRPLGRTNAVVQTDGARKGIESSMALLVTTPEELSAVGDLLEDASVLLLNIPATSSNTFDPCYVSVGDADFQPVIDKVSEQWMTVTMPFTVVDRPAGGTQAARTYADVLAAFGTYAAVLSQYSTYSDLLAGP